ncbi:MAG: DUF2795 domain-containing protein, partial [Nocardiopsaceae bacterium]|nr:DUF2795 domain-containing protein [Nocardiopsaceae bacterium]
MERGNTKHGPAHDEQLAHDTEGMVRGSAQRGHIEEWREPEPVEDSVPSPSRRRPGQDVADEDVADRSELARVMTRDYFPATREDLLSRLADSDAPQDLADRVATLPPDREFGNVHAVLEALGIASPETGEGGLAMPERSVVVFGQLARDLVLVVAGMPDAGHSSAVRERHEMLGGKGANQAVALAQLDMRTALVAAAGDDPVGTGLLRQAERDGIDVSGTSRRPGTRTGLVVDIVDRDGQWRYLEELPSSVLLNQADVAAAARLLTRARWASVQLQQPPAV